MEPGTHLVERALAQQLEVSRVPVREALQRLMIEGVLRYVPGRGLVTRIYDEQEVLDLYLYREPLEGVATRLFARRADQGEIDYLQDLLTGMRDHWKKKEFDAFEENDFEFHRAIARGSRNSRLQLELSDIYQECLYITRCYFAALIQNAPDSDLASNRSEMMAEHENIYDAIVSGDEARAEESARASIRASIQRIMRRFASAKLTAMKR